MILGRSGGTLAASVGVAAGAVGADAGGTANFAVANGVAVGGWHTDHTIVEALLENVGGEGQSLQGEGQDGEDKFERHHFDLLG